MKFTKRMLAAILALAMALTLCLPAMADDEIPPEEPNPAMPVITMMLQGARVKYGQPLTLTAEAYVPNGDAVRYEWYGPMSRRGSGASLTIDKVNQYDAGNYLLYVYNASDKSCYVKAELVRVDVQMTVWGVIWEGLKMTGAGLLELPIVLAMGFMALLGFIALPFAALSSRLFGWPFPKQP